MLNKKLTEDDVREMFVQFGHIEDCTVLKDSEGKSRGTSTFFVLQYRYVIKTRNNGRDFIHRKRE